MEKQKYGTRPYAFHLDAVADLAAAYGEDARAIAYLHDVVEDTAVSVPDIEAIFGSRIAECVSLLTDKSGADREKRKASSYAVLATLEGSGRIALVVKAADRLANVRACLQDGKFDLWERYKREHRQFRQAVYRPGLCEPLWAELERLLGEAPSRLIK